MLSFIYLLGCLLWLFAMVAELYAFLLFNGVLGVGRPVLPVYYIGRR